MGLVVQVRASVGRAELNSKLVMRVRETIGAPHLLQKHRHRAAPAQDPLRQDAA